VSLAVTMVTPRGRVGFIRLTDALVDAVFTKAGRLARTFERRDQMRSSQPVVTLAVLLFVWLGGSLLGYALLLWPTDRTFGRALREAGSSLFTLGFAAHSGATPGIIDCLTAATGLIIVTLQIAYLPTLYSAYNRRETDVTLLAPLAGIPAWGPEILARAHLARGLADMPSIYATWRRWAADVAESHSSYPILLRFRSPEPHQSWLIAQLAILDAAALHLAACPSAAPFEARLCLQMGYTSLRKLCRTLRLPVNDDPRPDDPIQLTWEEFQEGWERMQLFEFPAERSAEAAWPHFRGWRVNYEAAALTLARGIDAVPARWSGSRRLASPPIQPRSFANRTPDNPEGIRSSPRDYFEQRAAAGDALATPDGQPIPGSISGPDREAGTDGAG
jgi:hypothetical protein